MLINPNSPPSSPSGFASAASNIGFTAVIGGEVMSCTETFGFEREIHNTNYDHHENFEDGDGNCEKKTVNCDGRSRSRSRRGEWRNVRPFPPLLSSLNRNGQPCFFLRPMRKDGRLELTEVRIHRPQILLASRHDGRLTLHFVPDRSIQEEEEDGVQEQVNVRREKQMKEQLVMIEEGEEEQEEGDNGYGDYSSRLRRCHEMVNQNDHDGGHIHQHHMKMCGISIV